VDSVEGLREYWSEEEPEEPEPFGINEVNQRLAARAREAV
jgi:hypothetical protein